MIHKKAQGISINVIIIAAIALIVLVVLFAVFTGRMGLFGKGVQTAADCDKACKAMGNEKGILTTSDCPGRRLPGYVGEDPNQNCCCEKAGELTGT